MIADKDRIFGHIEIMKPSTPVLPWCSTSDSTQEIL